MSNIDEVVIRLAETEKYLREEADINRSWTDGRRGPGPSICTDEYIARRLELARQREEWADAIAYSIAALGELVAERDGLARALDRQTAAAEQLAQQVMAMPMPAEPHTGRLHYDAGQERDALKRELQESRGMADCMHMLHQDMIDAGVLDASVPPMMMSEAIIPKLKERDALSDAQKIKHRPAGG